MPTAVDRMAALSDATRREIFHRLSLGPCSVGDIAKDLPVSRPAVSQHLRVLADAGLVTHRTQGTRHVYQLDPEGVAALRDYLDGLWRTALKQFKTRAESTFPKRKERRP